VFTGCVSNSTSVKVTPQTKSTAVGNTFQINITCYPSEPIRAYEFKLVYNASYLRVENVTEGDVFSPYQTFYNCNISNGTISVYGLIVGNYSTSELGNLLFVNFTALSVGTTSIDIEEIGICNYKEYVNESSVHGVVIIHE
jgi:hypothetical protein